MVPGKDFYFATGVFLSPYLNGCTLKQTIALQPIQGRVLRQTKYQWSVEPTCQSHAPYSQENSDLKTEYLVDKSVSYFVSTF